MELEGQATLLCSGGISQIQRLGTSHHFGEGPWFESNQQDTQYNIYIYTYIYIIHTHTHMRAEYPGTAIMEPTNAFSSVCVPHKIHQLNLGGKHVLTSLFFAIADLRYLRYLSHTQFFSSIWYSPHSCQTYGYGSTGQRVNGGNLLVFYHRLNPQLYWLSCICIPGTPTKR